MKQLAICLLVLLSSLTSWGQIKGFTDSESQLAIEEQLDQRVTSENIQELIKKMSLKPHHVGSPYGKEVAEFINSSFNSWGFESEIATYYVLFPTPEKRQLELLSPNFKAGLEESILDEDVSTQQTSEALPPYNCFSIDGDVTSELVFVNYGIPADYEELKKRGISVKGKIVIAKYAGSWRGIKPKVAAENGAIGCIIYSDPADDGYARGDVYPKGPFKNAKGVQRGSVLDMPLYPGDPLTPGYGATKDAKRLKRQDAPTLTQIPVLPISYEDALPLLKSLEGPVAPSSWRGALPITYHIGPSSSKVRLNLKFDWQLKPAYNVIAKLKGSEFPDQWVIRGNHHDAWVHGAADPVSGMAALMEEARVIGQMAKEGKAPKRTVVYCAWDAEEPGLLGSTEWVEDNSAELKQKAVAYINTDGNSRGFLHAGGSHSLEAYFESLAMTVDDPQTSVSVGERRYAADMANSKSMPASPSLEFYPLGSGSDYTPFIQHLGIASINLGFGGEGSGGEYHTNHDSYEHYKRFKDPKFEYGAALSRVGGRATLRLANADRLPFVFSRQSNAIHKYLGEIKTYTDQMRTKHDVNNTMIEKGYFNYVLDPLKAIKAPSQLPKVPYLNFAPLDNAVSNLKLITKKIDQRLASGTSSNTKEIDELIFKSERQLTHLEGLPGRPWFQHLIYAPGFYTGYGVKTLPAVRESIEQFKWELAEKEIQRLANLLNSYSDYLITIDEKVEQTQR